MFAFVFLLFLFQLNDNISKLLFCYFSFKFDYRIEKIIILITVDEKRKIYQVETGEKCFFHVFSLL